MTDVGVRCTGSRAEGWTCTVTVRDGGRDLTTHEVRVAPDDLERLAPDAADPVELVERSFRFLLEREPPESILRTFDLAVIGRYFPAYEREIRRPMREPG
jgi:hypothetical protein